MTSKLTVNLVVIALGVFLLAALGGIVYLIDQGTPVSDVAVIAGPLGVALGALASILASTRAGDVVAPEPAQPPAQVQGP